MARSIYTNGPKSGQYRGFGTSQSTFVLECALDELIEKLGDDPIDFRLRNCIEPHEKSFLGYPLEDILGYPKVLEAVRPHYQRLTQEAECYNLTHTAAPWRRGVGLSGMWYRFGKAGDLNVEVHAELAADGHFIVYCSAPDYGQGTQHVMESNRGGGVGVNRECVEIVNADTARVPNSDIQGASRATFFVGGAVQKAADALQQSLFGIAAEMLDVPVEHLNLESNRVTACDDKNHAVSLVDVAREFDRMASRGGWSVILI
jgi:CO/xanthine dehydrogenase Mo-binding subunit